jgi:hypothetical protein
MPFHYVHLLYIYFSSQDSDKFTLISLSQPLSLAPFGPKKEASLAGITMFVITSRLNYYFLQYVKRKNIQKNIPLTSISYHD